MMINNFLQIKTLNILDSGNCSDRFDSNRHIGWIILMGLYGSFLLEKRKRAPQASTVSSMTIDNHNISAHVLVDKHPASQSNPIVKNYASLTNS